MLNNKSILITGGTGSFRQKFIKKRNQIAKKYIKMLKNLSIQIQYIKKFNYSTFHLFVIRFNSKLIKKFSYKKIQ